MPDRTPDELAHYWDALTSEADPTSPSLDPSLTEVIRRFEQSADVPGPDSNFVATLMEDLMYAHALPQPRPRKTARSPLLIGHRDSVRRQIAQPRAIPLTRNRWLLALVSAALLVVSIGIATGPLRPGGGGNGGNLAGGPAIYAPASPSPDAGSTGETLFEITIPADQLPPPDSRSTGLAHFTIPPGDSGQWTAVCCPGPLVQYVISGQYTVQADDPLQVIRADGKLEDVPARTEVTVGPGETLLSRIETEVDGANNGTEPVELLSWVLPDDPVRAFNGHFLPRWRLHATDITYTIPEFSGAASVRLQSLELAPDERVSPPEGGRILVVTLDVVQETIYRAGDGSITAGNSTGASTTKVYVITLESADRDAATPEP